MVAAVAGTVGRIMRQNFVTAGPEETLDAARRTMHMARLRHLVVVRGDTLVGILSYREILESLLARVAERAAQETHTVGGAMRLAPAVATPETTLAEAANWMCRYGLGCLPVLAAQAGSPAEVGRLVGIITESDLLRAAYALR
jgi:CBS domain-containing protein